ncbi:MAG: NAD(P)/FAD-dependent oxidoreductase [Fimbriimonas sp.]
MAVVGAGIAGLAAGRELKLAGLKPVLFEKSRSPGGRVATRRKDGFVWDTGATSIAPRGGDLLKFLFDASDSELVEITRPIYVHEGLRPSPGDPSRAALRRIVFRSGINRLGKLLGQGLDIRYETTIQALSYRGESYWLDDTPFDAVILTPPVPQVSTLLWGLDVSRPLAQAQFRCCLSVLLGFKDPLDDLPYWALLDPSASHPMQWLSVESIKSPGRAPAGATSIVVQLSPSYSFEHYATQESKVIADAVHYVKELYRGRLGDPVVSDLKRWKYSQPTARADFASVNPPGSRVLIAGDGVMGSRVEDAFESGVLAARQLLEKL